MVVEVSRASLVITLNVVVQPRHHLISAPIRIQHIILVDHAFSAEEEKESWQEESDFLRIIKFIQVKIINAHIFYKSLSLKPLDNLVK